MGFPRIISKNNKIYTKLGEFCLSSDATHFFIICHTCQEELQTQDQFWKHVQDEHNFLHGLKEHTRTGGFLETDSGLLPLPLYRKINDDDGGSGERGDDDSQDNHESKDYTEMRAIEPNVEIDIKVEPPSLSQSLPPPPLEHHQHETPPHVETTNANTLYQLPNVPPSVSGYATIVHAPTMNMTVPPQGLATAMLMAHEIPKDSNSTTASASSGGGGAVSSEDGERWYICDYETCGLKFKYQSRLELHRAVHSKERRFACEVCGASFKQSCNLSTHRKKKHFLRGSKSIITQATAQHQQQQQQQQQRF